MDGLDALLREATLAREEEERKNTEKKREGKSSQRNHDLNQLMIQVQTAGREPQSESVKVMLRQLKDYLHLLLDPSVLDSISNKVQQRGFSDLEAYCHSNPGLVKYTMDCELERMHYTVITRDGNRIRGPAAIRALHAQEVPTGVEAVLWSLSNQSLFADVISAVQPYWMDTDLSISVSALTCSFDIDLRAVRIDCIRAARIEPQLAKFLSLSLLACSFTPAGPFESSGVLYSQHLHDRCGRQTPRARMRSRQHRRRCTMQNDARDH